MLSIEKLLAVKTIIVHDACPDGLASAIILKDAYAQRGLYPEIRFVQYGTEGREKLEPAPGMLFCDFSPYIPDIEVEEGKRKIPDPEKLKAWVDSGTIVLDHHAGAKNVVLAFGKNGVFADEKEHPGVSGAFLAYGLVWTPLYYAGRMAVVELPHDEPIQMARTNEELLVQMENALKGVQDEHDRIVATQESETLFVKDFAVLAGIRDTWQNKHPRWREALVQTEVLFFFPHEDWLAKAVPFHPGNRSFWTERLKLGDLLLTKHEKSVKRCIEGSWKFTTAKGTRVLVFEGVTKASDAGELVDKGADIVMAFNYFTEEINGFPHRKVIYSLRSHTGYDCAAFAKTFPGGGGHTAAAGFNIDFDTEPQSYEARITRILNPYTLAEHLLGKYEAERG
jgi:hypothetical protein